MKVLHLPISAGGNAWGLAQGERRLGLESRVLVLGNTAFDYPADVNLHWERRTAAGKVFSAFREFLRVRKSFDVYHFNFGSSLLDFARFGLPLLDLPFYPKNKKIVFTYNGCDARQKYQTVKRVAFSACHDPRCYGGMCESGRQDAIRKVKIKKVGEYADHIFSLNPDLLRVLPERAVFLPYTISSWYELRPEPLRPRKPLRILHAPTDRRAKGSEIIMNALNNLKKKFGSTIEITVVENVPNEQALQLIREAHLVVDQVLIGWYGGLAVEAMRMGKPVAVFIREEDLTFLPARMRNEVRDAFINITPDTIEATVENYIDDPSLLIKKSEAALDYVHRWHDPEYAAGITKSVYENIEPVCAV